MPAALRLLACGPGVKTLAGLAPAKIGCGVWLTSGKQLEKEKLFSARPSCSPAISWNGAGCPSWDEPSQASSSQAGILLLDFRGHF